MLNSVNNRFRFASADVDPLLVHCPQPAVHTQFMACHPIQIRWMAIAAGGIWVRSERPRAHPQIGGNRVFRGVHRSQ